MIILHFFHIMNRCYAYCTHSNKHFIQISIDCFYLQFDCHEVTILTALYRSWIDTGLYYVGRVLMMWMPKLYVNSWDFYMDAHYLLVRLGHFMDDTQNQISRVPEMKRPSWIAALTSSVVAREIVTLDTLPLAVITVHLLTVRSFCKFYIRVFIFKLVLFKFCF